MVALSGSSRSARARLLGCSLVALAAGIAGTAQADCLPPPPLPLGSTHAICTGVTNGGLSVIDSSTVTVSDGATLNAGVADAAAFTATSSAPGTFATPSSLIVNGHVAGGAAAAGVRITNGFSPASPIFENPTHLDITVGRNGVIDGATGILLDGNKEGGVSKRVTATLNNSGVVRSLNGPAIASVDMTHEGFTSITNQAGGYIGGIRAIVGTLNNNGTIDGGADSAYAFSEPYSYIKPSGVINSGLITSNSVGATLALGAGTPTISNSGRIVNAGSGAAIDIPQIAQITNSAGGLIGSAGPVAIRTGASLKLVNRGVIDGSVVSTSIGSGPNGSFDTVGGRVNGDVLLGSDRDTFVGTLDAITGKIAEVSGRVDGGSGVNTLQLGVNQNVTLDGLGPSTTFATSFQKFQIDLSQGAIVTFNTDTPDGLVIGGSGGVVTNGAVTSAGTAFATGSYYSSDGAYNFTNNGQITSTFANPDPNNVGYAVNLSFAKSVRNTGQIVALGGGGVSVYINYSAPGLVNTGSIIADGTALNISGGPFVNDGVIRSNAGRGVYVSLGGGTIRSVTSTNRGTIDGVTNGVVLSSVTFANSGTVKATNGVAINPGWYSAFDNLAGGVVTGSKAAISFEGYGYNAIISNAGVINGDVDLSTGSIASGDVFFDKGGTLNGNLLLGDGDDMLFSDLSRLKDGKFTWLTGQLDAGRGYDQLTLGVSEDGAMALDAQLGFESVGFELKNDAKLTLTASTPLTSTLKLAGKGSVDLNADMEITDVYGISVGAPYGQWGSPMDPISIVSRGALSFKASSPGAGYGALVLLNDKTTFENTGDITVAATLNSWSPKAAIQGGVSVINSGRIVLNGAVGVRDAASLTNSGTILQGAGGATAMGVVNVATLVNSGTIETGGTAVLSQGYNSSITNSGRIASTGANAIQTSWGSLTIVNQVGGTIEGSTAAISTAVYGDSDTLRNNGVIIGAVDLGGGDDRIENYGAITGAVYLRDGNDTFVQWVGATMTGVVDGGAGLDTLVIDSTGGGSILASQFINFERFKQIGGGAMTYAGAFDANAIALDGGSARVLAGTSVSTTGAYAFRGGAGSESIDNAGTIAGGVSLGDGVDTVVNRGVIGGVVRLGAGDDTFTEGAGSTVGGVDGGDGTDTYIVELAGDRTGLTARSNFERLGVTGAGKISLSLDQNWSAISLEGAAVDIAMAGFEVGGITGGDGAESVKLDGDIASIALGGGDDRLTTAGDHVAGVYTGGAGSDALTFTTTGVVSVSGAVSGFETLTLAGGQIEVSGSLGATGDTLALGAGDQTLSILNGGALSGTVDLGAGSDTFRLAAGGHLLGTVMGGEGDDLAAIDLTSDLSLRGDQLQQFETLRVTGTGALSFTGGSAKFDHLITTSTALNVIAGSSLNAGSLQLSDADNRMTVGGAFTGQLDMGGGNDTLRLTTGGTFTGSANAGAGDDRLELALGGTDTAPVALGATPFVGFETLALESGVVSMAGDYGFDRIDVLNGRLIGLAGSRLRASNINVAAGATFGSAGAVVGDIAVAGILSPGASPGTMTVTGNVALATGSQALFELTPTVSDKLVVSGTVSIAPGSTLKLVGALPLTPGRLLDLIVADGGINGSFSTIEGAQALNLHIRKSSTRLQALGLFTTDPAFSTQASGVIGVLNTALINDKASAGLIAAMPSLAVAATGKSDPAALVRITPQAYASATQLGVENGLTLVDATRDQARFAPDAPGLFGFGQAMTNQRTLDGDAASGVAKGKIDSSGVLAGMGFGVKSAWVGGFVGYLDGRERIKNLDARTDTKSFVFGVQGQVRFGDFELGATLAHDRADADTRRVVPAGSTATGDYKLTSWVGDVNLGYRAQLNADWVVKPRLGFSYVRTRRDGFTEQGGGAFALGVQGEKATGGWVDGQVELQGGQASGARLHPYVSVGFRSQVDGGAGAATASIAGLDTPLRVTGLGRGKTLATFGGGVGYELSQDLTLSATYAGELGDGARSGALVGLRWKF